MKYEISLIFYNKNQKYQLTRSWPNCFEQMTITYDKDNEDVSALYIKTSDYSVFINCLKYIIENNEFDEDAQM